MRVPAVLNQLHIKVAVQTAATPRATQTAGNRQRTVEVKQRNNAAARSVAHLLKKRHLGLFDDALRCPTKGKEHRSADVRVQSSHMHGLT